MFEEKLNEIRDFFEQHADPENVKKFSRYFKDGFKGYGIDMKTYEQQKNVWLEKWSQELTLDDCLTMGEKLVSGGNYEEASLAILLVASRRQDFTPETFRQLGKWFEKGLNNWASTDVLCMFVLKYFLTDERIGFNELKEWNTANSEWQRRAVPVTLNELVKTGLTPGDALPVIEPLMKDSSEYVQKGIGTLLRGLWQKYPSQIEDFLHTWKDVCGRLIVRYATEKMDKEKRKLFAKKK